MTSAGGANEVYINSSSNKTIKTIKVMEKFSITAFNHRYSFEYPTSIDELDADWLLKVSANIKPAKHYSLIALIYKESLNSVVTTYKQRKKNMTSVVVPIFIKAGETDSDFINSLQTKDKLVISPQMLQLAYHVNAWGNSLSIDQLISLLDEDPTAFMRTVSHKTPVCFVEFKIIENNNIVGASTNVYNDDDKYLTITDVVKEDEN